MEDQAPKQFSAQEPGTIHPVPDHLAREARRLSAQTPDHRHRVSLLARLVPGVDLDCLAVETQAA